MKHTTLQQTHIYTLRCCRIEETVLKQCHTKFTQHTYTIKRDECSQKGKLAISEQQQQRNEMARNDD